MRRLPRFTRDANAACACDGVERPDCPVADVRATDDTLVFTLDLPGIDRLRGTVAGIDRRAREVGVRETIPQRTVAVSPEGVLAAVQMSRSERRGEFAAVETSDDAAGREHQFVASRGLRRGTWSGEANGAVWPPLAVADPGPEVGTSGVLFCSHTGAV